jgi:DNA-directed RNA polymerase subunit K/omega
VGQTVDAQAVEGDDLPRMQPRRYELVRVLEVRARATFRQNIQSAGEMRFGHAPNLRFTALEQRG